MSNSTLAAVVATLVVLSSAGAATAALGDAEGGLGDAYGDDALSAAASEFGSLWGSSDVAEETVRYGAERHPSVVVTYSNGSAASLQSWANSTTAREVVAWDRADRQAIVTAPPSHLGISTTATLLNNGLAYQGYVETLDLNLQRSYTEPVDLQTDRAFSTPVPSALISGGWSAAGVAFASDAPRAHPAEVREVIDAEGVAATGAGVTVGVCDTGINTDEGTVFGNGTRGSEIRITAARNFVTDEDAVAANDFANVSDGNGHGTWVASAIAADPSDPEFEGMAPDASLVIGKALADDGSGSTADIADCIDYMEAHDVDVLSLSLGSPIYSASLAQELEAFAEGPGTIAVVAAGNSRLNPATRYVASPADTPIDGVLTVAATNAKPPQNASSAYFSQVGPDPARDSSNGATLGQDVDIAAPGMNTTVTTVTTSGTHRNSTLSGTSMATPYVAGSLAVALDANPSWVNETDTVRGYALNTTSPMPNAGVTEVGHGMIDVSALVDADPHETTQSEARSADAVARDEANRAYSGSSVFSRLAGLPVVGAS